MKIQTENYCNVLRKYPFSLFEMDGSLEIWQKIYSPYIDSIESKINISKNNSIKIFRNHNFAFDNELQQRIADLIINEVEDQNSISKSSGNYFEKLDEKIRIEDQYSEEVEKKNSNLKITFVFTNKKMQPLRLIQMLKLTGEVEKFTQLLHKNELKQHSKIVPQIIFISLFGFEASVRDYLRDNLYGKLNRNISILVVPPIDNKLWNNYFIKDPMEDNEKHNSGISFERFNNLRKNGAVNQLQVKRMETYYKDLKDTKQIIEDNFQELNTWADVLSINDSPTLLNLEKSRNKIKDELKIKN
jgi:hypothetical protein